MNKTTEELQADFDKAFTALCLTAGVNIDEDRRKRCQAAIGFMRDYALSAILDVSFPMDDVDKLNVILKLMGLTSNNILDLQFIAQMSEARWLVDSVVFGVNDSENANYRGLNVDQVAFLADLKPQSVRNRQVKDADGNPKNPDGLRTVIIEGQTLVDARTAYEWLKAKSGYKKTVRISAKNNGRDWGKSPLADLIDLGCYLRETRRHGKSDSQVGNLGSENDHADLAVLCGKLDLNDEWSVILGKLEYGDYTQFAEIFSVALEGLFVCWADAHDLDADKFILAVFALHVKLHSAKIRQRVQNNHAYYRLPNSLPSRTSKSISMDEVLSIMQDKQILK